MARFKNVSPLGDLEVPLLGHQIVEAGEVVDVPTDLVPAFAGQASWEPTNKETRELVDAVLAERVEPDPVEVPNPDHDSTTDEDSEGEQ